MAIGGPKPYPCASCPYRRDVPSGVWAEHEYRKLPDYDAEMGYQPTAVFMCHQDDQRLCSGWVGCHGAADLLALRLAALGRHMDDDAVRETLDYVSPVALFGSGVEACEHGLAEIETPGIASRLTVEKIQARRERRGEPG